MDRTTTPGAAGPEPDRPARSASQPASAPADPVERILGDCLLGTAVDVGARVEAACQRHPEHAAELRARLRILAEVGFFGDSGPEQPAAIPERLGGFKLLRRLGSGGMGVVYLAHEEALDRTVALKLVRPEHLYFPDSLSRFHREVRIIAGLRHPGIVPVYSVGEEQGIPFFAMEHVTGANLQEVLTRFHERAPERLTGRDLIEILRERAGAPVPEAGERAFGHGWQEVGLRLVLQVAEALDHVHAHGVLHRDIKPSNLMVTPAGRVMLLDFGLSSSEGAARITRSGAVAGSLPYMSPEQLRGGIADVDPRTDVYSLGVTLYELLTLTCPYLGKDGEDTRRRILLGEAPPLRERNRAVTWDAETVCLKAMDRDPARRYQSAAELAQDLTRVLEFRPIAARRPGTLLRLRRLAQRRPAAAVAVGLGSVMLLGAPLGWAWLERDAAIREAKLERDAAVRVAAQREDAERSLKEALRAVNQMLTRVGASRLRQVPQSLGVRRELLADAMAFCARLRAARPDDPAIRHEAAEILVQAAGMQRGLGEHDASERSMTEAIALLSALLGEGVDPRSNLEELAKAEIGLGNLDRFRGRLDDAQAWTRRGLEHIEEWRRCWPDDREAERSLGEAHAALAEVMLERGDGPAVTAAAKVAVDLLQGCLDRDPKDLRAARAQVFALFCLGDVRVQGPTVAATETLRRATDLARPLVERFPDNTEHLELLAVAEAKLCILLEHGKAYAEAETVARSVLVHRQKLASEFPGWVAHQMELGGAYGNLGMALMRQKRHEEALEMHKQALAVQQRALAMAPGHAHILEFLHTHRANIARTLLALQRPADVLAFDVEAEEPPATSIQHHLIRADFLCSGIRACGAESPDGEGHDDRTEALGRRAVASLEAAVDAGFGDLPRLQTPGLSVLRGRADYRALLNRVKAQSQSRPGR